MAEQLRVGIIGCGGQGSRHAEAYVKAGCKIVGACDIDLQRAEALAQKHGAKVFSDYNRLLSELKPDIVSVCTKEPDHAAPTIAALRSGIHVLCEKMMADRLAAAKHMVNEAKKANRILAVGFNYRQIASVRWLKSLLDSGKLGEPLLLQVFTHAYCHHHVLDLCRFLFGEVVEVTATFKDDISRVPYPWHDRDELLYVPSVNCSAALRFEGEALAVVNSTIHVSLGELMIDLQCFGTNGWVALRQMKASDILGEVRTSQNLAAEVPDFAEVSDRSFNATFDPSIAEFVEAVRSGKKPPATGEDGLAAMRLEHAIIEAQRYGQRIRL